MSLVIFTQLTQPISINFSTHWLGEEEDTITKRKHEVGQGPNVEREMLFSCTIPRWNPSPSLEFQHWSREAGKNQYGIASVLSVEAFVYIFRYTYTWITTASCGLFSVIKGRTLYKGPLLLSVARKNVALQLRCLGNAFQNIENMSLPVWESYAGFHTTFMLKPVLLKRNLRDGWIWKNSFLS